MLESFITSQKEYLAYKAKPFMLQDIVFYRFQQDNKFCRVLQLDRCHLYYRSCIVELEEDTFFRHYCEEDS
jgi:hypothetical protein